MLHSPGHSPRHLSSPSPSLSSADPPLSSSSSLANPQLKSPSKRGPAVLDEDSYVAAIEKIIERDFFPDIPKLRDRLDWLEAVMSGDPVQIRDAQLKIMERRRVCGSSADTFFRNSTSPFDFDKTSSVIDGNLGGGVDGQGGGGGGNGVDGSLTLDQFFRRYTSDQDDDSFSKIMEKVNKKRNERYGYLVEGEKEKEKGGRIEDVKKEKDY